MDQLWTTFESQIITFWIIFETLFESLWLPQDPFRIALNRLELLRIALNSFESSFWILLLNSFDSLWFPLTHFKSLRISLNPFKPPWIPLFPLNPFESHWITSESQLNIDNKCLTVENTIISDKRDWKLFLNPFESLWITFESLLNYNYVQKSIESQLNNDKCDYKRF